MSVIKIEEIPFVVECMMFRYFEPIAAFNVESAAIDYAEACLKVNSMFTYRVVYASTYEIIKVLDNQKIPV
jgi:hypothetical protein